MQEPVVDRATLDAEFASHQVGDRTPSAAMLAWFLINVERLDPELVPESICDGSGDKGIDALVVNDELSEITIYQAKRMDSVAKRQGDQDLKNFMGAARYFDSVETIRGLLNSKPNQELRRLLLRNDVESKVEQGYQIRRIVYVTNSELDAAGESYASALDGQDPRLDIWHAGRLSAVARQVRRADMRSESIELKASMAPIVDDLSEDVRLAIALVPASELVKLPGIDDLTLFSRNVRLSAGNTRINRELARTVADDSQHAVFAASHNGITILTVGLDIDGETIALDGASVVNGCQSLLALYRAKDRLTPELRLVVKFVELPDARSNLSDTITYRANNQNAVNVRDQRSTDRIQLGLQRQVEEIFGNEFAYIIKVGQVSQAKKTLDNLLAAQLITAVYRKRPWAAVRKVRLFEQDYYEIFAADITGYKLRLLRMIDDAVDIARDDLRGELRSSFASVRFTLASLVAEVLRLSVDGTRLLESPETILVNDMAQVTTFLADRARDVAINVNDYVQDAVAEATETGADFDPKVVFKSSSGVAPLRREVVTVARRLGGREADYLLNL